MQLGRLHGAVRVEHADTLFELVLALPLLQVIDDRACERLIPQEVLAFIEAVIGV